MFILEKRSCYRGIALGLALLLFSFEIISNSKVITLLLINSRTLSSNDKLIMGLSRPTFFVFPFFENLNNKVIYMKVTGYHSEHCVQNDLKKGRTMSWSSACNTHGVASDHRLLPLGTILYIDDERLHPNERLRFVDDGCQACIENGEEGIHHIDVRFLEYKEKKPKNDGFVHSSSKYDGMENIKVYILRVGNEKSTRPPT